MGRSGKLPSGVSAKLKRWKKGHSSDSNPVICRHRQAARSRFFSRPSGMSDLTVDAVKLHNELQSGSLHLGKREASETPMEEEAELAVTEKSSGTFLSGLSDCTNVTFSKVQRFWESNSAAHKEQDLNLRYCGSWSHLFCWAHVPLLSFLLLSVRFYPFTPPRSGPQMTTMEAVESPESLAAVAYLLNLVLKRVPSPVLIKKFSDTSKAFMDIVSAQASSGSTSVLRWVLSCLATLLRKQDLEAWGYPVTLQVYHGLLSFTVHPKPKIRKAAQHGVCSVLKGSEFMFGEKAPAHHPAAVSTAKFCIQEIEKSGGSKEATTTLHMLTLLKDLLPCFPEGLVKSSSETLLRVMTLSHVLVTACAMQAFHSLFHARPGLSTLSAELNAQIITALYDYVPSENDLQPLLAWLKVMEKAHVNLVRLQWDLGLGHLPRFFGTAVTCLLSPHAQVVTAATHSLKEILKECVAPHMADIGSVTSSASGPAQSVVKMFRAVEEGLTYKFHAAWSSVLQLLCVFFEACGRQAHLVMRKCLQSLCDLRLSPHFPHTAALDQAVGAAVTSMGPEVVLQAVPLEIDGSEETLDFPRSWLLPVIRDHVQETRLGFFTTYFLPLANTLKSKAMDLAQAGHTVESKIYDTLQWQIWTLLPGFCTRPTDVAASFKGLARTLGMAISERPDLRVTVCQALRTLITKGCEAGLMGTSTVEQLLENVCLLLASRTRDVVKSALGFIKVVVTVMGVAHLAKHVQLVMEAIGKLSDDMRRHFRMKLRNLFTKFIRKFGFELVKRLLPEEYHKVLVNIRKAEARAKRHRALSQAAAEEEDEEEDEEPAQGKGDSIEEILADSEDEEDDGEEERSRGKEQRKLAQQRSRAWLKEGGGDEPLNFLDPRVAQRVLATQPGPGRGRKKDHGFKVSADGRLIIKEDDTNKMEEEEGAKGEDEEMADLMEDVIVRNKKHQKLKHQKGAEEEELEMPPQYQAGGSGIHRPVAKKAMPGAEYKAKKAKGDVKRKGRPDPYAYIPLNRTKLNHRKKTKLQGQFKGLVKAARRGSQVGHKNRRKDLRP
ncbi:RRP12-like protein [Cebus imitator]|uniref:RRP12-like protein n=1 Tax=Cebus imitator TaxID=2715852 RepID=UPI001898DE9D|nr:RRP12-like protein [Cebus imitator]